MVGARGWQRGRTQTALSAYGCHHDLDSTPRAILIAETPGDAAWLGYLSARILASSIGSV